MSDEDDDDLFADSGEDTDDLIAASSQKPVAKPKKLTKKSAVNTNKRKRKIPGKQQHQNYSRNKAKQSLDSIGPLDFFLLILDCFLPVVASFPLFRFHG